MRKNTVCFLTALACIATGAADANWQYPGTYVGDGWYQDDGSRFIISGRGGASFGRGSIKNEIGSLAAEYFISPDYQYIVSAAYYQACRDQGNCGNYLSAGLGDLSKLPATKDLESFAFAVGASIGWTLPNRPQWRLEAGWDHIGETDYNASPMFEGDLELTGGQVSGIVITAQSGAVQSTITTDIISVMAFYDFFDGLTKPTRQIIPYVGFGVGYADTKTVLNLSDPYGDLSTSIDLLNFGQLDSYKVIQFYKSEQTSSNIAGLLAAGMSYGITDTIFLDLGARIAYIPRVKWTLTNADDTRHRDWFNAENLIYANIMLGLRFEF